MELPKQSRPVVRNRLAPIVGSARTSPGASVQPSGFIGEIAKYGPYAACYWACKAGGGDWVECETDCLAKYG